jgi:hypothetical protein
MLAIEPLSSLDADVLIDIRWRGDTSAPDLDAATAER